MNVSEARLAANRLNSQKSTGPKTLEGKAISRQNGLKHGLTGEGIVVPEGDREEIERRIEALQADMRPRSPVGVMMIARMATLSVRAERAAERETAAIAERVRNAIDTFDEERFDKAEALFDALHENPRGNLRRLKKMPEGVDRLLDGWRELRDGLTGEGKPCWTAAHLEQATLMTGTRSENARNTRLGALSRGAWGEFLALADDEGGNLDEEARKAWARDRIVERIDAEISGLEAHRETLDFERIELDRLESPTRAMFDPSPDATRARRYEADADRRFFKSLNEFRQSEAESAAREEATPSLPTASRWVGHEARMGSSCGMSSHAGSFPSAAFPDASMAEIPVIRGPEGQPLVFKPAVKQPG
jgi:hypothetical protein